MIRPLPPPEWAPSNREYHREPRWSSSRLRDFRKAPQLAYRRYVTRTVNQRESTPSLTLGAIVNALLLRPNDWRRDIVMAPCQRRSDSTFKKYLQLHRGKEVVTEPELEEGMAVAKSIRDPETEMAEVANALLLRWPGWSEYAWRWDDTSGVSCKSMVDRAGTVRERPAFTELKSSRDPTPEAFARDFDSMGYDCQAAFNLRGGLRLCGVVPDLYVIAVRNEEPYDVWVYMVAEEFIEDGTRQVDYDLLRLGMMLRGDEKWCTEAETMKSGYLPYLQPPPWKKRRRAVLAGVQVQEVF